MKWSKIKLNSKSKLKFKSNLDKKFQEIYLAFKNEFKSNKTDKPEALIYKAIWKVIKDKFESISYNNLEEINPLTLRSFFDDIKNDKKKITSAYIEKNNIEVLEDSEECGKFIFIRDCIEPKIDSRFEFDVDYFFEYVNPKKMEIIDNMIDVFRIFTLINFDLKSYPHLLEDELQDFMSKSQNQETKKMKNALIQLQKMDFYDYGSFIANGINDIEEKINTSDKVDLQSKMNEIYKKISELKSYIKISEFEAENKKNKFNAIKKELQVKEHLLLERIKKIQNFIQASREKFVGSLNLESYQDEITTLKDKLNQLKRKSSKFDITENLGDNIDDLISNCVMESIEEIEKNAIKAENFELNSNEIYLKHKEAIMKESENELMMAKANVLKLEKEMKQFMRENSISIQSSKKTSLSVQQYIQNKKGLLLGMGAGAMVGLGIGLFVALYLAPVTFGLSIPIVTAVGCILSMTYLSGLFGGMMGSTLDLPKEIETKKVIPVAINRKPKLTKTSTMHLNHQLDIRPDLNPNPNNVIEIRESTNDMVYLESKKQPLMNGVDGTNEELKNDISKSKNR